MDKALVVNIEALIAPSKSAMIALLVCAIAGSWMELSGQTQVGQVRLQSSGLSGFAEPLQAKLFRIGPSGGQEPSGDVSHLSSEGEVFGRVFDQNGTILSGVMIWLVRAEWAAGGRLFRDRDRPRRAVLSDSSGFYEFNEVDFGDWWVGVAPSDDVLDRNAGLAGIARVVRVLQATPKQESDLRVYRDVSIEGIVLGPAGRGVQNATVRATLPEVAGFVQAKTDSSGAFVLGPIVQGSWSLTATDREGVFMCYAPVLSAGGDRGVRIALKKGGRIEGIIRDQDTGCLTAATCELYTTGGEGIASKVMLIPQTSFRFRRLLPAEYTLVARTSDGRIGVQSGIEVVAGEHHTGVEVHVCEGALLRVSYEGDAPAAAIRLFAGDLLIGLDGVLEARVQEVLVPKGLIHVECRPAGKNVVMRRQVDLSKGDNADIRFSEGD